MAILRNVSYKGYITKLQEPLHKCEIFSFKMYGIKYMLKYTMQIKMFCASVWVTCDPFGCCLFYHHPQILFTFFYFNSVLFSPTCAVRNIRQSRNFHNVSAKQKQRRERVGTPAQEGSHVSLCCQVTCWASHIHLRSFQPPSSHIPTF